LTDADFDRDPARRYVAGALDEFRRHSTAVEVRDTIDIGESARVELVAYRHDTKRVWHRLDRFSDSCAPSILAAFSNPSGTAAATDKCPNPLPNASYLQLLSGQLNSSDLANNASLVYVTNDWRYVSEGVQADATYEFGERLHHKIRAGARLHYDSFDRYIPKENWAVQQGSLVRDGTGTSLQNDDLAQTLAISGYASDAVSFGDFTLTPGIRFEYMDMHFTNRVQDTKIGDGIDIVLPGVSVMYTPIEPLQVFAGVHRGFSPPLPQDVKTIDPETSINYELGARYRGQDGLQLELTGFFSDYDNMTTSCTTTGGTCEAIDHAYNAGRVYIGGLEAGAGYRFQVGELSVPLRASYTFIDTSFRSTFDSADQQLGHVDRGDKLPYVPTHQGSLLTGVAWRDIALNVQGTYMGSMREDASRGNDGRRTDELWLLDVAGRWQVHPRIALTARLENVVNQRALASRRPWGARPLAPFQAQAGVRVQL
jgi:Fe(3+) dicitrate transport protein